MREVLKCLAKGEKGDIFLFKVARYRVINLCGCETDLEAFLQGILKSRVGRCVHSQISSLVGSVTVASRTLAVGKVRLASHYL